MSTDYLKFRGKCKELSEAECKANPELTLVRGHYYCPIWNTEEPHWWCEDKHGNVIDPSAKQFPSKGLGVYTPFDGRICCAECGGETTEDEAYFDSNYAFCSSNCYGRFVGLL